MFFKFANIKISGISTVVPPQKLSLLDEKNLYKGDRKKLNRVIESSGFLYRRVCEESVMTSDLCLYAANDLLSKLKVDRDSIDALLFLSYTPDYLMPATSYILHKNLKLNTDCIVMDIPQACSAYVLGLFQASMLINSGCKKVLVLVGDSFSKFTDMFKDNAPIFGDAGSATLLEYDHNALESYYNINSDGNMYDSLMCENFGFRNPPTKKDFYEDGSPMYKSSMDGGKIFNFTLSEIAPSIEKLFKKAKTEKNAIDYFVFHQANRLILENIARKLDIPYEKTPMTTLTEYGNQCGASIPCTISDTLSHKVSMEKTKLLLSGFGVGLSWASALVSLDKIYCSNILKYGEENE